MTKTFSREHYGLIIELVFDVDSNGIEINDYEAEELFNNYEEAIENLYILGYSFLEILELTEKILNGKEIKSIDNSCTNSKIDLSLSRTSYLGSIKNFLTGIFSSLFSLVMTKHPSSHPKPKPKPKPKPIKK